MFPYDVLKIDTVEMYPRDNAKEHRTERYELLRDSNPSTVLRRGQAFFMALRLKDRALDPRRDILRISFIFGRLGSTCLFDCSSTGINTVLFKMIINELSACKKIC